LRDDRCHVCGCRRRTDRDYQVLVVDRQGKGIALHPGAAHGARVALGNIRCAACPDFCTNGTPPVKIMV